LIDFTSCSSNNKFRLSPFHRRRQVWNGHKFRRTLLRCNLGLHIVDVGLVEFGPQLYYIDSVQLIVVLSSLISKSNTPATKKGNCGKRGRINLYASQPFHGIFQAYIECKTSELEELFDSGSTNLHKLHEEGSELCLSAIMDSTRVNPSCLLLWMSVSSAMQYTKISEDSLRGQPALQFEAYAVTSEESPVTVEQWTKTLQENNAEIIKWTQILANCPYDAFLLETPPIENQQAAQRLSMEFVLVNSPALYSFARGHVDTATFAEHFDPDVLSVSFSSVGGDARLFAPTPREQNTSIYSDLAVFSRQAPQEQQLDLWKLVLGEYLQQSHPVWLSTSGLGVAWLHVRLDSIPKYYTYGPYKKLPESAQEKAVNVKDDTPSNSVRVVGWGLIVVLAIFGIAKLYFGNKGKSTNHTRRGRNRGLAACELSKLREHKSLD